MKSFTAFALAALHQYAYAIELKLEAADTIDRMNHQMTCNFYDNDNSAGKTTVATMVLDDETSNAVLEWDDAVNIPDEFACELTINNVPLASDLNFWYRLSQEDPSPSKEERSWLISEVGGYGADLSLDVEVGTKFKIDFFKVDNVAIAYGDPQCQADNGDQQVFST